MWASACVRAATQSSMAQPSVDDLRDRKRVLSQELVSVANAVTKARRAVNCRDAAQAREWVLVGRLRQTALAVYVLAGYAPEPVIVFLRGAGRQRRWCAKTDAELLDLTETAFLHMDLEDICALCDEDAPADGEAFRRAVACVAQWRAVSWSRVQLAERHVAPDTETLAVEYEAVRATFTEQFRPRLWLGASGARKQGTRLRQRWGGRCGVMRPREVLPAADMREKVALHISEGRFPSVVVCRLGMLVPTALVFGTDSKPVFQFHNCIAISCFLLPVL